MSFKPYGRYCGADVITAPCTRVYLSALKSLLWPSHWRQVEVQVDGPEDIEWEPEIEILESAAKAVKGVARLMREQRQMFSPSC